MALPLDTTIEAARVQAAVWRRLGMEKRLRLALEMIENARSLAESGVRWRHPEYSEHEVRLAAIRLRLGEDLFRKAYPGQERGAVRCRWLIKRSFWRRSFPGSIRPGFRICLPDRRALKSSIGGRSEMCGEWSCRW